MERIPRIWHLTRFVLCEIIWQRQIDQISGGADLRNESSLRAYLCSSVESVRTNICRLRYQIREIHEICEIRDTFGPFKISKLIACTLLQKLDTQI